MVDKDVDLDIGDDDGVDEETATGEGMPESPEKDDKPADPQAAKAELDRVRKALAKANKEAERLRLEKKTITDTVNGKAPGSDEPTERETAWQRTAINLAARAAFREAGFTGTGEKDTDKAALGRLVKLIDSDDLEFDPETGEVDGMDEEIALIKAQFPGLFQAADTTDDKKKAPVIKRGGGTDPAKPPTSTQRLAKLITG